MFLLSRCWRKINSFLGRPIQYTTCHLGRHFGNGDIKFALVELEHKKENIFLISAKAVVTFQQRNVVVFHGEPRCGL